MKLPEKLYFFHVVPKQDTHEHDLSLRCWCRPSLRSEHAMILHPNSRGDMPIVAGPLVDGSAWQVIARERCVHDTDADGNCPIHPHGCP
jgi:hypothetical protein